MALAAGAKGAAGGRADARFVNEAQRQRARIGKALDRAKQIERRFGLKKAHPPRRLEPSAERIARPPAPLDLPGKERLALLERRDRGALGEDGDARRRELDEVL